MDEKNANARQIADALYQAISEFVIIDAHEHLPPETERLTFEVDAVSLWENYPRFELITAGMTDAQYATMIDRDIPVDDRWSILRAYLPLIRQTAAARTTYLSVRELYGFDDINDSNYLDLTEAMRAANKPGIYRRVYRDYCRAAAIQHSGYCGTWGDWRGYESHEPDPSVLSVSAGQFRDIPRRSPLGS